MNPTLIEKIKEARLSRGLKQSDVAELLGVKKNTISNWENGKANPNIDSLIRLCEIYNVRCSTLLESSYGNTDSDTLILSDFEKKLIKNYRTSDTITKELVHRSLGMGPNSHKVGKIS